MAQQIMDINNSPLFTELTAEEAASVNGGSSLPFDLVHGNSVISTTEDYAAVFGQEYPSMLPGPTGTTTCCYPSCCTGGLVY